MWRRYLLPPITFMSVIIGGGYATGRELVEFFMPAGPVGGLIGMAVTAIIWSTVFALSLDFARSTASFEYRSFFKGLLGRGWLLFEVAYVALMLLVLAVLGAASGEIATEIAGVRPSVGTAVFLLCTTVLVAAGTRSIERFFSIWAGVLYLAFAVFFLVCLVKFGEVIAAALAAEQAVRPGWLSGGVTYAGYNLVVIPALLFCARYQRSRRESWTAGLLTGPVAILPAVLFYIALLARYPEVEGAAVPLQVLLHAVNVPWLTTGMRVAVFGTLVQTATGLLHGFNERLLPSRRPAPAVGERMSVRRWLVSLSVSLIAIVLATRIGLIALIASGYGMMSWVILVIFVMPLVTVGVWRMSATRRSGIEPDH